MHLFVAVGGATCSYDAMRARISPGGGWRGAYGVTAAFAASYAAVAGAMGTYISPQAAGRCECAHVWLMGMKRTGFMAVGRCLHTSLLMMPKIDLRM